MLFKQFYVVCSQCNHRNRPHASPAQGVRLALLDKLPACKRCGKELHAQLSERPLVKKVREQLIAEGLISAA